MESGRDSQRLQIAAKKQAAQEKKNEFFSCRKKFLGLDSRVKQLKSDIQTIDANIAEVTQQEARDKYEEEVAQLGQEKVAVEGQVAEKTQEIRSQQQRIAEMEEKVSTLQGNKTALSRQVASCKELMQQIQNETDNLAVYGSHIPRFVKLLEHNKSRFSQLPLGPIGRYLEVPDERYKGIIEQLVSSQLGSFIVNTAQDQEVLMQLFKKEFGNKRMPSVIQRPFRTKLYDTSQLAVQTTRYATSPMEQLRCKNAVVLNTIIDMTRIEQVLICENMDMGRKLTENIENVPRNLKRVIVMEPLCEVYPQPNFRIYSWTPKRCNFIQVSAHEKRM